MGSPAYNREHTVTILLRFNKKTDKDIIERFNSVGNKVAYVKRLIRADLESCSCQQEDQHGPIRFMDSRYFTDGPQEITLKGLSIKEEPLPVCAIKARSKVNDAWSEQKDKQTLAFTSEELFTIQEMMREAKANPYHRGDYQDEETKKLIDRITEALNNSYN